MKTILRNDMTEFLRNRGVKEESMPHALAELVKANPGIDFEQPHSGCQIVFPDVLNADFLAKPITEEALDHLSKRVVVEVDQVTHFRFELLIQERHGHGGKKTGKVEGKHHPHHHPDTFFDNYVVPTPPTPPPPGPRTFEFSGSASSGTPDTVQYKVAPGSQFKADVSGTSQNGGGTFWLNVSNGTPAGVYSRDKASCDFIVPNNVDTLFFTVVTDDIGYYRGNVEMTPPPPPPPTPDALGTGLGSGVYQMTTIEDGKKPREEWMAKPPLLEQTYRGKLLVLGSTSSFDQPIAALDQAKIAGADVYEGRLYDKLFYVFNPRQHELRLYEGEPENAKNLTPLARYNLPANANPGWGVIHHW